MHLKNTFLTHCLVILISISACKKQNIPRHSQPNTFIGAYYCEHHLQYYYQPNPTIDSLLGYDTIKVFRSGNDTNAFIVNGDSLILTFQGVGVMQYSASYIQSYNVNDFANFYNNYDSISFFNNEEIVGHGIYVQNYLYTGHKIY